MRGTIVSWITVGLVFWASASSSVIAAAPEPEIRVADNVYVVPDTAARSITGWLIVKAGCADEAGGDCRGIAHYLEHLLFINRDAEHSTKFSIFAGGSANGWTNHRSTTYFQRFPSNPATDGANVDKLLGYLMGLLADVKADPAQADRERNVVLQEYNLRTGRNAYARFLITLNRALMPDEPLGQRGIGSPETIATFSLDAARAFHKTWYARSNAVLVLHGPVEPETVRQLAAKYYDTLPAKPVPGHLWTRPHAYPAASQTITHSDKEARQVGVYLEKLITYDEPAAAADRMALDGARRIVRAWLASLLDRSPLDVLMEQGDFIVQGGLSLNKIRSGTLRLSFWGVPANGMTPEQVVEAVRGYIGAMDKVAFSDELVTRLRMRLHNEHALLARQPDRYADALVSWLGGHGSHAAWRESEAANAQATAAHVHQTLALLTRPGREVVGILRPAEPGLDPPATGQPLADTAAPEAPQ